jgi:hypothetical protein
MKRPISPKLDKSFFSCPEKSKINQTRQIVILLAWNVQKSPKLDKSLVLCHETSKIPPNWTNTYSFAMKRPKSLQTGQIFILLAWNLKNPPN